MTDFQPRRTRMSRPAATHLCVLGLAFGTTKGFALRP